MHVHLRTHTVTFAYVHLYIRVRNTYNVTPRVLMQVNRKPGVQSNANMESVGVLPETEMLV